MKKFYKFLSILAIPSILLLYSYSGGSPGGRTGSPGDGTNCTECHDSFDVQEQDDWITTDIPAVGYMPGETYTITATGSHEAVAKLGFELTAENSSGDKVGSFAIVESERTQFTNDDKAVTHTQAGNVPTGDSNMWEMEWIAPSDGAGTVTFYAAFNAADGNGNTSGDQIYTSMHEVIEFTTGFEEDLLAEKVNVYPNPSANFININLPEGAEMRIVDMLGHELVNKENVTGLERIDVSGLKDGIYFVQILHEGAQTTKRFMKN